MRSLIRTILPCAFALMAAGSALGQSGSTPQLATPQMRITAIPSNDALVTLKGSTPPMAKAQYDQGPASPTLPTGRMTLLLQGSAAQRQALTTYLGALGDPQSPNYHKWLTPQQFGANFGIANQDLQTVEAWLQSEGFKIDSVPASRQYIRFSGTVGQVEQAFHTSIHRYTVNGQTHYSNNADPQIPEALAPVVAAVTRLNDFLPKPQHVTLGHGAAHGSSSGRVEVAGGVHPALTGSVNGSNASFLFVTASDAATIYDAPNPLNRNYSSATTERNGSGVNIGLVGDSDLQTADYLNYRKLFLGETNPTSPTEVIDGVDPGVVDGGAAIEALLDAENAAALAPGAGIYFYSSNDDLFESGALDAALRAIEDNTVSILNVSFGECEADLGPGGNAEIYDLWQQAAAQGITVVTAAGDSGSAGCDSDEDAVAQGGLAVSGYASTPYDLAVGGTDFDVLALTSSDFTQYVSSSANTYYGTALSYIPENPWDDSSNNNPPGAYTADMPAEYDNGDGGSTTIVAAGAGGPSSAALCSTYEDSDGLCPTGYASGYPLPSFQSSSSFTGTPLAGSTVRELPDISLFASPGDEHQAGWALCSDNVTNADTSGTYTDCQAGSSGFTLTAIGGTSASAPAYAGILAMVSQSLGGQRLGVANQVLYNLAATQYSTVFHDITAGNNAVPCTGGTPDCGTNGFETGFNAGTGYDMASGLGSVDIAALVNAWSGVTFTPTSVALTANAGTSLANPSNAAISITHGAAVTFSATVTPTAATGTVALIGPAGEAGGAVNEIIPLTSGTGSVSVVDLPGGNYTINAYYPGDATHAPSTSATGIPMTVNPEASVLAFEISEADLATGNQSTNPTVATYGEYGYIYAEPENTASANGTGNSDGVATGTVTLATSGSPFNNTEFASTQTLNSTGTAAYPLYDVAPGSYSFSATYSGDKSYNASTSATLPLTIQKGATTLSVKTASTTIAASASDTVTVELDTDSAGAYPTGSITLSGNGTTFAASSVVQGTLGDGAVAELATFSVPGSALASGSNTLTASYAGDTNYSAAANQTTTISVTGSSSSSAGFAVTGPSAGITIANSGSSGMGTLTITPTNGFTGTVSLSCKFPLMVAGGVSPACSLPSTVSITGTAAVTATVTVTTTAASSAITPGGDPNLRKLLFGGSGVALAGLLLWGIPARRRSWRSMLVVLLAFGLLGAVGCGSSAGSGSSGSGTGTPAGTYVMTVTATSGSTTANAQVNVVVE